MRQFMSSEIGLTSQLQSQISIDPWAMYPDSSNALSNNPKVWWSLCANVPHNGPPVLWAWIYGVILWFRVILVIGLFHKLEYASNIRLFWKCFWWTEMKQTKWCTFNSDLKSTFNTKTMNIRVNIFTSSQLCWTSSVESITCPSKLTPDARANTIVRPEMEFFLCVLRMSWYEEVFAHGAWWFGKSEFLVQFTANWTKA